MQQMKQSLLGHSFIGTALLISTIALLSQCKQPVAPVSETYSVGGVIDGLTAHGLELRLNGDEKLQMKPEDSEFAFASELENGSSYTVEVATQPGGGAQTCEVSSSGVGTIAGADVADVAVTCSTDYSKLFSLQDTGLQGLFRGSASFADVDGDDDPDLVLTGYDDAVNTTSTLYTNDGTGGFVADSDADLEGVYNSSSSVADVDNDGDTDLVITGDTSFNDPSATLYRNEGSTGFVSQSKVGLTRVRQSSTSFADVDGDGDPDLLSAGADNSGDPSATLHVNDGSGSFDAKGAGLAGVDDAASAFADVDNDGDADLVISGYGTSNTATATLYLNQLE